jgi:hypothetical protein
MINVMSAGMDFATRLRRRVDEEPDFPEAAAIASSEPGTDSHLCF